MKSLNTKKLPKLAMVMLLVPTLALGQGRDINLDFGSSKHLSGKLQVPESKLKDGETVEVPVMLNGYGSPVRVGSVKVKIEESKDKTIVLGAPVRDYARTHFGTEEMKRVPVGKSAFSGKITGVEHTMAAELYGAHIPNSVKPVLPSESYRPSYLDEVIDPKDSRKVFYGEKLQNFQAGLWKKTVPEILDSVGLSSALEPFNKILDIYVAYGPDNIEKNNGNDFTGFYEKILGFSYGNMKEIARNLKSESSEKSEEALKRAAVVAAVGTVLIRHAGLLYYQPRVVCDELGVPYEALNAPEYKAPSNSTNSSLAKSSNNSLEAYLKYLLKKQMEKEAIAANYERITISGNNNRCWLRSAFYLLFDRTAGQSRALASTTDTPQVGGVHRLEYQIVQAYVRAGKRIPKVVKDFLAKIKDIAQLPNYGLNEEGKYNDVTEKAIFQIAKDFLDFPEAQVALNRGRMGEDAWLSQLAQSLGFEDQENLPGVTENALYSHNVSVPQQLQDYDQSPDGQARKPFFYHNGVHFEIWRKKAE